VADVPSVEPTAVAPAVQPPPGAMSGDEVADGLPPGEREDRRAAIAIIAVVVLALLGVLLWWLLNDDEEVVTGDGTTTTETTTTATTTTGDDATTVPPTSAPPTTAPGGGSLSPDELSTAIFPYDGTSRRFDDPVAAARAFATDLIGFTDPVMGSFAQGDNRSGEVEVRSRPNGPATTVMVRRLSDDTWWIMGADTANIVLENPRPGSAVDSPLQLSGRASAFEGTVEVSVHQDGSTDPLGEGFVTGGATEELGPFNGEVTFSRPDQRWGALVLRTINADDGRVWQASVVRVGFIGQD
jgi:hypothetical protein